MYVYIESQKTLDGTLYTVGFYDPTGKWHAESDHTDPKRAADRVAYLNGANVSFAR